VLSRIFLAGPARRACRVPSACRLPAHQVCKTGQAADDRQPIAGSTWLAAPGWQHLAGRTWPAEAAGIDTAGSLLDPEP
jgi:hypothetical protein